MSQHIHAKMICAKANNQELIVLTKAGKWVLCGDDNFYANRRYFLCVERHKDACLHYLNGGEVAADGVPLPQVWRNTNCFMCENYEITIIGEPKTETHWIVFTGDGVPQGTYKAKPDVLDGYQVFEIEVEVD